MSSSGGEFMKPRGSASGGDDFTFGSMVRVLKEAMAQALVPYYAFAGEILSNSLGEAELLCNNRGVDFLKAYADVKLQDLNLYNPDESIEGKLAPTRKHGVLSVQVTELKCGGIVVACTFDHRIADDSTNMFLVSWAEMAHPSPLSVIHLSGVLSSTLDIQAPMLRPLTTCTFPSQPYSAQSSTTWC
ncbi:Spermidine hydroxycinnamoyl transferase [Vitis vinifera]|uniref:Spermidine hydroxycinnamoyl transferase n=1 Tax=Vitis vinifera TaxID=29760 RepID=A0A438HI64_VITVI|nr:Spermidine hydroxycinnamoyl transferase [Vitis vinifera]